MLTLPPLNLRRKKSHTALNEPGLSSQRPALPLPLHLLCLRDIGLTLGEMFDLDDLAEDCATDGVWEFLFTAPPLRITGGVGSPLNPLAVK